MSAILYRQKLDVAPRALVSNTYTDMQKLQITVVLGTARNERSSLKVSDVAMHLIGTNETVNATHVDVRDYAFTKTEPGWEESSIAQPWREIVQKTDGFLFIIPEYNRSFPGELKLLLDSESPKNYNKRAAAIVAVSSGAYGGARVVTSIQPVLSELGLVHTNKPLLVQRVNELFEHSDEEAVKRSESFERNFSSSFDELLWYSQLLKRGREEGSAPE